MESTNASSILKFVLEYKKYAKEVEGRARQVRPSAETAMTEPVGPVNMKFCVDMKWLESTIALGFIDGIEEYDRLSDKVLFDFLESLAKEPKETINIESLDEIIGRELRMNISDTNAGSRVKNLFKSYPAILCRNGLTRLLKESQKVVIQLDI